MSLMSFNGVILPELPEWDTDNYSYTTVMYLEKRATRLYSIIASDKIPKYDPDKGLSIPEGSSLKFWSLILDSGDMAWQAGVDSNNVQAHNRLGGVVWVNFSLKNLSGAEIMTVSEPVPFDTVTTDNLWIKAGGKKLPEFPEWDRELYPYVYVVYDSDYDGYFLFTSQTPAIIDLEVNIDNCEIDYEYFSKYQESYKKPYWDAFLPKYMDNHAISTGNMVWYSEIVDAGGNVILQASPDPTPWPKFDLKTFCAFLAAGLCMPPIPKGARVPIAHSYNGTILPKLPKWNREIYPYALLVHSNVPIFGNQAWLYLFKSEKQKDYLDNGKYKFAFEAGEEYLQSYIRTSQDGDLSQKVFPAPQEYTAEATGAFAEKALWSNYTVKNWDGSVYLEKYDPVPIYE